MVRATAGNQVQCAAGVYVHGVMSENSHDPGFQPANSGTSGNEIVFFAETPAATNRGSSGAWSQLRWNSPPTIYGSGNPIMGATYEHGGSYVVFDGFYAQGTYVPAYPSQGAFGGGANYVYFRRIYYDYEGPTNGSLSDNYAAIFLQSGTRNVVEDCYITGNYIADGAGNHNHACITMYNTSDFIIKNNTFYDIHNGVFVKVGTDAGTNWGEISYNRFEQASYSCFALYTIGTGHSVQAHHNLGIGAGGYEDYVNGTITHAYSVYNNTFVGGVAVGSGGTQVSMMYANGNSTATGDDQFYNNIVVIDASRTVSMWDIAGDTTAQFFGNFTLLDHNCYYDSTAAAVFDGQSFANYKTALSGLAADVREAGSFESTVTFTGAGDYTLADNGQDALAASDVGGPVGCYVTGSEEIGVRASPVY
jgi:hypothetical protein